MSLSSILPRPRTLPQEDEEVSQNITQGLKEVTSKKTGPPPYGKRIGWTPRTLDDYGNGGAFPEIHISQYPCNMGKKKNTGESLTLQVDSEGKVKYDSIVRRGQGDDKVIHSKFTDIVPMQRKEEEDFEYPSEETIQETANKTRAALEEVLQGKIKASLPKQQVVTETQGPTYVRYTPAQQNNNFNSGAQSRVIRMVEVPKDPLEPPQFKHRKIPRGPPSPPPPVMHSPPRKVTAKEQNEWKIPPCISNWKNPKGYTIPLDKRLASDGRGLQETYISDGFAKLSGALYEADRQAREAVKLREQINKKLDQKQQVVHEEELRQIAMKAREEKNKYISSMEETEEDKQKAKERDEIRADKRREIEKELRLSKMSAENRAKILERNKDRDITEKVALGLAKPTTSQDLMYDQRLFNKTQGVASGFGDDESYSLYDKPLFSGSSANSVYRPKKDADGEVYGDDSSRLAAKRDGPVEFEEADPFGLDNFLKDSKGGDKSKTKDEKDRDAGRSREKSRDRDRDRERDRDRDRDRGRDRSRSRSRDRGRDRSRERDRGSDSKRRK